MALNCTRWLRRRGNRSTVLIILAVALVGFLISRKIQNGDVLAADGQEPTKKSRNGFHLAMTERLPDCSTVDVVDGKSLIISATDPVLTDYIKANVLKRTSPEAAASRVEANRIKRNATTGELDDPSWYELMSKLAIPKLFAKMKRPGTFFEAGALNTYDMSTTYYLEKKYGWTGLLMEMSPLNEPFSNALRFNRTNVHTASACISPRTWPCRGSYKAIVWRPELEEPAKGGGGQVRGTMVRGKHAGGIPIKNYKTSGTPQRHKATGGTVAQAIDEKTGEATDRYVYESDVICYPLISMLMAADLRRLDFFSLDVEGIEYEILSTLPWEMVDIEVIRLDFDFYNLNDVKFIELLRSKGYELRSEFLNPPEIPDQSFASVTDRYFFSKIRCPDAD